MGGGSGGPGRIGDVQSYVDRAKKVLREAEEAGKRNVFISFAAEDLGTVNLLRGQAKNENVPIQFNDWSVSEPIDSERASYIKERIADRIARSSLTVVYLSEVTRKSDWVGWEVEESLRRGKQVIGVYSKGSKPSSLPEVVVANHIKCVPWADLADTISKLE